MTSNLGFKLIVDNVSIVWDPSFCRFSIGMDPLWDRRGVDVPKISELEARILRSTIFVLDSSERQRLVWLIASFAVKGANRVDSACVVTKRVVETCSFLGTRLPVVSHLLRRAFLDTKEILG